MKKQYMLIGMLIFLVFSLGTLITAFLLDSGRSGDDITVGQVQVTTNLYYEKDNVIYPGAEVVVDPEFNIKKKGIYHINVVDSQTVEFIENVRISIAVSSDVDTYIRLKLFDQMILTTINHLGDRTEIPIIADRMVLNYCLDDWYYNEADDYYYYKQKVMRQSEDVPTVIAFIAEYFPGVHYHTRPLGYSVQVGIRTEAVQALQGPQKNWGMYNPPWGGAW
ncbi:MAG: hypothetical protein M0R05_03925 [Bacilli bacterium]|nr:hypothetical protein [Bacilli bacterium]MDD4077045.1 hypothetical protein [Bacilli bacterium]